MAEVQYLEAKLQAAFSGNSYNLTRILVDKATGSTLLRLDASQNFFVDNAYPLPSSLRRSDWIAQVWGEGRNPESLLEHLRQDPSNMVKDMWTLDYVRMEAAASSATEYDEKSKNRPPKRTNYTMKTLLCSIAHTLSSVPSLDPIDSCQELLMVDTGNFGCYLTNVLPLTRTAPRQADIMTKWAQRPFQYSSAININVAEIIIDLLSGLIKSPEHKVTILDPTCGSGTFLAFAMAKGMQVKAFDCNPCCVEGSIRNLEHIFSKEDVALLANVQLHDSSNLGEDKIDGGEIDCVVANLPWGVNSVDYLEENNRILHAVRSRISSGTPCAFVTRESSMFLFAGAGFQVLGQAHVPQREFKLPKGKKKHKPDNAEEARNGRNRCVVTIARSI